MDLNFLIQALKPLALSLLMPPLLFMVLTVAGGFQLQKGRKVRGWALLALSAVGIWLSGCEGVGLFLGRHWLGTPQALNRLTIERLQTLQAQEGGVTVLVLGGGARQSAPEYQGPSLNEYSMPRLRLGIWLSRQLGAPLAFAGGVGWQAREQLSTEAQIATRVAAEEFLHPLSWVEDRSRDTRENARFSLDLLKQHGVRTLVLVSHEQHLPRVLRAFREARSASGEAAPLTLIAAPVGLRPDRPGRLGRWLPSSEGYDRVRYVIYELLALAAGH